MFPCRERQDAVGGRSHPRDASRPSGATEALEKAAGSQAGEDLGPLIARLEDALMSCHRQNDRLFNVSLTSS